MAVAARMASEPNIVFNVAVFCSSDNPEMEFCKIPAISDILFIEPSALKNAFWPSCIEAVTIISWLLSLADCSAKSEDVGSNSAIRSFNLLACFCAFSISSVVMPVNSPMSRMATAASSDEGIRRLSIVLRDVPASDPLANDGEMAAMVVFRSSNETPSADATPPTEARAY